MMHFNPNSVLEIYCMEMLLHIYYCTHFPVLNVVGTTSVEQYCSKVLPLSIQIAKYKVPKTKKGSQLTSFDVGAVGFEPTTPWSQTKCANRTALCPECLSSKNSPQNFLRWRGDSNPRYRFQYDSLANCWFKPLTHPTFLLYFFEKRCKDMCLSFMAQQILLKFINFFL